MCCIRGADISIVFKPERLQTALSRRDPWYAGKLQGKAGRLRLHMHMQGVHSSVHIQISVTEYHIRWSPYGTRFPTIEIQR